MELDEGQGRTSLTNEAHKADASILPGDQLRQLGRSLPTLIPRDRLDNEEPSAQVQQLRVDLLHTAKSSNLSPSHGAAALNALCGFLDMCSTCQNDRWSSLCFCPSTCQDLFHIFLERSENFKAKPARQLLVTLGNALSKYPNEGEKEMLITVATSRCVRSISKEEDAKSIKSSIQALEYFMNKQIITSNSIVVASMGDPSARHQNGENAISDYSSAAFREGVEDFTTHVLSWVRYPDCASAISRFLPCFFASLDACRVVHMAPKAKKLTRSAPEPPFWIGPVRRSLKRDIVFLDSFESHVLPGLLRLSPKDRECFLATLPLDELQRGNVGCQIDADIQLSLLAVKIMGRSSKKLDDKASKLQKIGNVDPSRLCINLIEHSAANVRIAAFSLMISSSAPTEPLPSDVLLCLQRCIPHFHKETSQKTRNEFISLMKPFCARLGHAAKTFSRLSATVGKRYRDFAGAGENLMQHINLARWYQKYLLDELRPSASYQSHITALKVLPLIFPSNAVSGLVSSNYRHHCGADQRILTTVEGSILDHVRPILDLLVDPFDDVRQSASLVLNLIVPSSYDGWMCRGNDDVDVSIRTHKVFQIKFIKAIQIALVRAEENVQRTGRADHADGLGRLHNLYYGISRTDCGPDIIQVKDPFHNLVSALEQPLVAVGQGLPRELTSTSLHGKLIALRYIISRSEFVDSRQVDARSPAIQNLYSRLLACFSQVWHAVRSILCFDAPEGRNVYDDDDDEADHGSNDTLSFCWRALKESSNSLVMHAIVDRILSPVLMVSSELHDDDYSVYGRLIFTQLAELRHRGAFSTVAQTFAAWCVMCSKSTNAHIANLPKEWYQEILACVQQQAGALTRRSAGLPSMITGVLAAYPSGPFFDDVVLDLQAIADAPAEGFRDLYDLRLPQVHGLNCLKNVFTDSRFGSSTEGHIAISLGIAISSLESDIWAIRNCGLMLLKALLKRLNGGSDTASTRLASSHRQLSPLTYERFPILSKMLLRLLHDQYDEASSELHAQRIFPALEIVERFGIPDIHRDEILQALQLHRASLIWSIREKAAKTFGMIIDTDNLFNQMWEMIYEGNLQSQNEIHGRLLSLRVLFVRAMPIFVHGSKVANHRNALFLWLFKILDQYIAKNICPITAAAALNILGDVLESLLCLKGCTSEPKAYFLCLVLTEIPDETDVQLFLCRFKHLLQEKQATQLLYSSQSVSVFALKNESLSRCLVFLEDVHAISANQNADAVTRANGSKESRPQGPLNTLLIGVNEPPGSPHGSDQRLQLWGAEVADVVVKNQGLTKPFGAWIRALFLAMNASSELSTRLAAVASIGNFFSSLREPISGPTGIAIPVELLTILYDTLLDDDEDVRNSGATIVSSILSNHPSRPASKTSGLSLSPSSATARFLRYLVSAYSRSATLLLEAVWRLTGTITSIDAVSRTEIIHTAETRSLTEVNETSMGLTTVSVLLERAVQQQNVVFEEEKQNLYLDPVMEAEAWAQVVIDMELEAWLPDLAAKTRVWTETGLASLVNALDESVEGPLGLTSKADVYALFIQVALMARAILLTFFKSSADLQEQNEDPDMYRIMTRLKDLYERGQEKNLHPLILGRLQRILEEVDEVVQ